jgi:osmotically-inducible protein OsmY
MKPKYFITVILFVFLMTNSIVSADQKPGKLTDTMIKTFVEYRLIQKGLLTNDNIQVAVAEKTITLTGAVPTLDAKRNTGIEAQKVEETYNIQNNLTIKAVSISDSTIAENVRKRIYSNMFYTVFDWVTVAVKNGVVTLSGWANLPWTADQLVKVAEKVEGVSTVNNQIQKEQGPDELRYKAVRVIYSDMLFEKYAYLLDPPIHIIVNGPDITLEGSVISKVERKWAENLVAFNTDVMKVTNNLIVK